MNKTIWMCWFQGEKHKSLCRLNRKCINRWKGLNPTWQVNVLSNDTIADYVPEYFDIIERSPKRTLAAKSDLLRILLLQKFGGVWVDASVYPALPIEDFISDILNDVGFFTYRFFPRSLKRNSGRETVSWFMCVDRQNHYLIEKWKVMFVNKFKNLKRWKTFAFHEALSSLYDSDEKIKQIIDNMVQIDQRIPHSARPKVLKKFPEHPLKSYVYKRPARLGILKKPNEH
jgi:hypothetical protein